MIVNTLFGKCVLPFPSFVLQKPDKRYLLCPSAFTVGLLKKFIKMKFDLQPKFKVRLAIKYQTLLYPYLEVKIIGSDNNHNAQ